MWPFPENWEGLVLAWAASRKDPRQGAETTEVDFLAVLKAGSPR